MITVMYCGEEYRCSVAYKGADYIHLVDAAGVLSAAFSGIKDFSGFTISGGDWTVPTDDDSCPIAVVKDDGTLSKGNNTCNDISKAMTTADAAKTVADAAMPMSGGTFSGNIVAYGENRVGDALRNSSIQEANGNEASTNSILFVRK